MEKFSQKNYKVEYLCTLSSKDEFCSTISGLKSLLESFEKLKIENDKILWGDKEFFIEISDGKVLNSTEKYFHIKLANSNIENQSCFLDLLKVIRTILSKVNNNQPPEILWDDISSEYAINSYPIIHELENLMRKLITKFMITKVGLTWISENIPKEVSDSLSVKSVSKKQNYIYDTDFIQLSNFLFKDYTMTNVENFIDKIKKAENVDELDLNDLKKIVPLSNWTRYFNPILTCTSDELVSKWDKLYKLRCKVAHNNFMDEQDFTNLVNHSNDVKEIIQNAINNLDKVTIKEDEKDELVESAAISLNKIYGDFLIQWKKIESICYSFYSTTNKTNRLESLRKIIKELVAMNKLSLDDYNTFVKLLHLRNLIVHEPNLEIDSIELNSELKNLVIFTNKLSVAISVYSEEKGYYEIYATQDNKYGVFLKNLTGQVLFTGEVYKSKDELYASIEKLKECSSDTNNYVISTNSGKFFFRIKLKNRTLAFGTISSDRFEVQESIITVAECAKSNKIIDSSI